MTHYDRLISLSGGIDSTFALYNWLKSNPEKRILVHHVHMKNKEGRLDFEAKATSQIIQWLKDQGFSNFDFTESFFDYGSISHIVQDIELIGFFQGVLLRSKSYSIEKVIICASKYDFNLPGYKARARRRFNVIKALTDRDILFDYSIAHLEREQIIKSLPRELLKLTWFCRTPKDSKACGRCRTCEHTLPFLEGV